MKFLVTGLGSIGLRHARNLLDLGHEVYGEDTDDAKVVEAGKYGVIQFMGGHMREIEATVIASPTPKHAEQLYYAVARGWHCLVEKPIADEPSWNINGVLETARKRNLVVMVGNNQRFRACVQEAKDALKYIGSPLCATFVLSQHNIRYTDHVISNWGAHELDLVQYLLGKAEVVACVGWNQVSDIILRHFCGCQTNVHLDYLGNPETREFLVVGNRFPIRCDLVAARDNDESYIDEMKAFINRINGKPDDIGATGEDGLKTLKLITAAIKMAQ